MLSSATSDGRMRNTYKELKSQDFVDFERFQTLKTSNELVSIFVDNFVAQ